jgi:hypothetical protein
MTAGYQNPRSVSQAFLFWYLPAENRFPDRCYAAPAMYFANRPQFVQRSVTWQRGGGGLSFGSRSIEPEQDGQDSGVPLRSFAMRFSA